LVFIFEGMMLYVTGQLPLADAATTESMAAQPAQARAAPEDGQVENPYDVQFILLGQNLDVMEVRSAIDSMGDSTVVVGDETTIKVHIHVKDPGQPLSYGASLGKVTDVVVENMQMQMEDIVEPKPDVVANGDTAVSPQPPSQEEIIAELEPDQIGVVTVAAGPGLGDIFRSLGAAYVVNGGQTNNPSTEEIYQAMEKAPTETIILLPNNKNIILAAEAARDLSDKDVHVVPTRTAPQGISAMLSLNPNGDPEKVAEAMEAYAQQVATGEITRATRSVHLDGVEVKEGEIIGMVDGRLHTSGSEMPAVLEAVLNGMELDEREIISLYYGADVTAAEANEMASKIESLYPDIEIEVLPGGQPYYYYILGAE
jgi:hypothetical protein